MRGLVAVNRIVSFVMPNNICRPLLVTAVKDQEQGIVNGYVFPDQEEDHPRLRGVLRPEDAPYFLYKQDVHYNGEKVPGTWSFPELTREPVIEPGERRMFAPGAPANGHAKQWDMPVPDEAHQPYPFGHYHASDEPPALLLSEHGVILHPDARTVAEGISDMHSAITWAAEELRRAQMDLPTGLIPVVNTRLSKVEQRLRQVAKHYLVRHAAVS